MKSIQKAFGVLAVAGALVVTGSFVPKTVSALLPVEHETRNALVVEHDNKAALVIEHDNKAALVIEHDNKAALVVEHDSRSV